METFIMLLPLLMFVVLGAFLFSGFPVAFGLAGVAMIFGFLGMALGVFEFEQFFTTDTDSRLPMMTSMMLGGIKMPSVPEAAIVPVARAGS